MIASLPMYDRPEIRGATDRYWQAIRAALGRGPGALRRGGDPWDDWQAPDLLLSQTCGFPYRARLHEQVALVGTPDFGVAGCAPGYYRSVVVAHAQALPDRPVVAYNDPMSQSGWAAAHAYLESAGLVPGGLIATGSHAASARAVAEARADLAAIDAVTWRLLTRFEPDLAALRVLAETPPTPGLPYISARGADAEALFCAIEDAIGALAPPDRVALGLTGLARIPAAAYLAIPTPPGPQDLRLP